jgi:23S rRNA pseudouridine2457 synthase
MAQYLLFNKPYDVLTQFSEGRISQEQISKEHDALQKPTASRATLKDFIPVTGVYPVGRLDRDSEGLLLLTDHGPLQHRLSNPEFGHPRTYWVQVERIPDESAFNRLRCGIEVQDYISRPAKVQPIADPDLPPRDPPIRYRRQVPTAWIEMTLTEGRNRQVRRMTAAVGFPTLRLVRVAIAHLRLDGLAPGQWRLLSQAEVKQLYRMVGLRVP